MYHEHDNMLTSPFSNVQKQRRGVHQENDAAMVRLEKEGGQHKRAQHIGFWNHALFVYFCCNCMLEK